MNRRSGVFSFMADDPLDATPRDGAVKLSDIYLFFWRRWLLIGLIFLAVVVVNGVMLMQIQPRYTATAEVTLVDPRQNSTPIADLLTGVPLSRQVVEQEIATMRSKAFMIEVVKRLGVDETSPMLKAGGPPPLPLRVLGSVKRFVSGLIRSKPAAGAAGKPSAASVPLPQTAPETEAAAQVLAGDMLQYGPAADRLAALLQIEQSGNGYGISLSAEAADPLFAAAIANAVAAEYPRFSLGLRSQAIEEQVQLLSGRVEELGHNLEEAETAVVDFQTRVAGVNQDNADRLNRQIENLGRALIEARTEIVTVEAQRLQVLELVAADGPAAASQVLDSPILNGLRLQLSGHRIERSRAAGQFGADAPQVAALDAVIARVKEEAALETARIVAEYETRASIASAVVASIEEKLTGLEQLVNARSRNMVELAKLRRIADANRIAYEEFLKVATESAQLKALQQPSVRLLSFAEVPQTPSAPRSLLRLAIAGVAGLAIGLGAALLLELTSNSIKTTRALRQATGLPVIGSLSHLRKKRAAQLLGRLGSGAQLPAAERTLVEEGRKLALFLSGAADRGRGTIVFTSALPGEGKAMTAALVAHALAARGQSVILVDAAQDSAKASRAPSPAAGDTEAAGPVPGGVVRSPAGYWFLSVAETARTGLDCLPDRWIETAVTSLADKYDYVLINTTPVLSLGNVSSFLRHADALVVASRWNATAQQTVETCIERLRDLRAQNIYAVMTGVKRRAERKYEYPGFMKTVKPWWKQT
ncbi:exopolysaccharide transport family protein (plasmid) [Leisingera sp. M527]|uniref:GumC family protein n=1 Tax=Leisingera sp. M527 TaxID=2867014 RepID=UPI0021A531C4|nr:exopolysaccharide transport family protein [Leisingera sp. M527]UWQ35116.1 exopolysaccharide transport family protein [Leisingera sp. M527]